MVTTDTTTFYAITPLLQAPLSEFKGPITGGLLIAGGLLTQQDKVAFKSTYITLK